MTTASFLADLNSRDVRFLIGPADNLMVVAPPGVLTGADKGRLRLEKARIAEAIRHFVPAAFHDALFAREIAIWTAGDRVEWHDHAGRLTDEDREAIEANRPALVAWLQKPRADLPSPGDSPALGWLEGYLTSGPAPVAEVRPKAVADGFTLADLDLAARQLRLVVAGPPGTENWGLPVHN